MFYFAVEEVNEPQHEHRGTKYVTTVQVYCAQSKTQLCAPDEDPIAIQRMTRYSSAFWRDRAWTITDLRTPIQSYTYGAPPQDREITDWRAERYIVATYDQVFRLTLVPSKSKE